MLRAPTPPSRFVIESIVTLEHPTLAFIGCRPQKGPTNWCITEKREEAYVWDHWDVAREFKRDLETPEGAYGLVNDGHLWHVVPVVAP